MVYSPQLYTLVSNKSTAFFARESYIYIPHTHIYICSELLFGDDYSERASGTNPAANSISLVYKTVFARATAEQTHRSPLPRCIARHHTAFMRPRASCLYAESGYIYEVQRESSYSDYQCWNVCVCVEREKGKSLTGSTSSSSRGIREREIAADALLMLRARGRWNAGMKG